ncbi:uncharacterized protein PV06_04457 [Exophiala oligosperma]|uniref:Protein kinase domain-containing protein n=1 Tax=Exophiala oligosperma TaxID=215243 RepID=A0A0D2DLN9_9EURO|nr:uncharacterized protein PV06_04457 [Exophiala oligosperma]KIW43345.1 hypothetical protein PV06_04457 [Exophiala oligosperma]
MASIQRRQPTHKAVILDLIKWVDDNSVNGIDAVGDPAPFMPTKDLREHLRDKNRLRDILKALFEPEEAPTNVSPTAILTSCTSVFAILIRIQKGAYISEFLRHRVLFDHQLPFLTKPPAFPSIPNDDFYDRFCKEQWRFCAHTFTDGYDDLHIPDSYILPILTTEALDEDGTADVQKVTLHPEYDRIQPPTKDTEEKGITRKPTHTYVLKLYRSKRYASEELYKAESEAFIHLRNSHALGKHFIGYYGSFTHGNTRNILLEYANYGSLETFFSSVDAPTTGEDIIRFWQSMFGIIDAVCKIHTIPSPESQNAAPLFNGWHQDIKPENILVSSGSGDGEFEFKLADLGLAHFHKVKVRAKSHYNGAISGRDVGGTREYGAPECYRGDESQNLTTRSIGQAVDIWSLGCVYSEFAHWIAQGKVGLQKYRDRRVEVTKAIPDHLDPGCFHDKERVLTIVKDSHDELFKHRRVDDFMVRPVIKKMVEEMLDDADGRPTAVQLGYKAKKIIQQAEKDLHDHEPHRIISRSSTTQSWELNQERGIPQRSSQARPPKAHSSHIADSYLDKADPLSTVTTIEESPPISKEGSAATQPHRVSVHSKVTSTSTRDNPSSSEGDQHPPVMGNDHHENSFSSNVSPPPLSSPGRSNSKDVIPHMTISQALFWISCQKYDMGDMVPREHRKYMNELADRDHVFLIDDAATMKQHWSQVLMLTFIFASFLKRYDDDGMDVYFASSREGVNSKNVKPLMTRVFGHLQRDTSDIGQSLERLVTTYIDKIDGKQRRSRFRGTKEPKPFCIYVLTDGIWEETSNARSPIKRLVDTLKLHRKDPTQVGIQFIFFGSDQQAREKLEWLDDNLGLDMDIVDMEPADGNVLKMLTGAILKKVDRVKTNGLNQ